jgi:nitroreductase/dihydropteridine reductase
MISTETILQQLKWRYAVKKFDPLKKISQENFETLLESLRLTASSFGLQFWQFVVVENTQKRELLVEQSFHQRQVLDASHLLVLCSLKNPQEKDVDRYLQKQAVDRQQNLESLAGFKKVVMDFMNRKNPEAMRIWLDNQLYIALGNLLTTAAMLEIDACPMEGFSKLGYSKVLDLDTLGLQPVVVCPVGYRASDDKYASLAKTRFTQDQVVTWI